MAEIEEKSSKALMSTRGADEATPYVDPTDAMIQKRLKQLGRGGSSLKRAVATAVAKKRKSKSPKKEQQQY